MEDSVDDDETPLDILHRIITHVEEQGHSSMSQSLNSISRTSIDIQNIPKAFQANLSVRNNAPSGDRIFIEYMLSQSNNYPLLNLADIALHYWRSGLVITAIEPVFRSNLLNRFIEAGKTLYSERHTSSLPSYGKWDIAFHGTPSKNIIPIVQNGFWLPGYNGYKGRFAGNWGKGIYCSPSGMYSVRYGHKNYWHNTSPEDTVAIFVVAVLRGRPYRVNDDMVGQYSGCMEGYDSHVDVGRTGCEWEWIVFDSARIIPLCLLWVKRNSPGDWDWSEYAYHSSRRYPRASIDLGGEATKFWMESVDRAWNTGLLKGQVGVPENRGTTFFSLENMKQAMLNYSP